MKANPERISSIQTILDWLTANLPLNTTVAIDRTTIVEKTGVNYGYLSKVMVVLINKGYVVYKQLREKPSEHRLVKDVSGLSATTVSGWVTAHQTELGRQSMRNRVAKALSEAEKGNAVEPEPAKIDSLFNDQVTVTPESPKPELTSKHRPEEQDSVIDTLKRSELIDLPLTPTQQRLKQMQEQLEQLQKEVEEEAKQQVEVPPAHGTSDELFTLMDNRIESIEGKVNVMLTFFEQATAALRGLSTIGDSKPEEVAEPTTRVLLVRRVNSYAAATRQSEHETWKYLYGQMDLHLGFNAYAQPKVRDQSYLTVIEERGQIDALYDLAKKLLVLPALK